MRYGEMVRRAAGNPDGTDPDKDCIEQLDGDKKPVEKDCVSYSTSKTVMF